MNGYPITSMPKTPTAMSTAPALVTRAMPKHRCSAGRLAAASAPIRKWTVTAVETRASGVESGSQMRSEEDDEDDDEDDDEEDDEDDDEKQ